MSLSTTGQPSPGQQASPTGPARPETVAAPSIPAFAQGQADIAQPALWLPRAAALVGCTYFLAHSLRVLLGPEHTVMEWLYDDTFYYMITASHFSAAHISSFDGITSTSGYHPLWMWLCALVYGLRGQLDLTYVRCCMALALAISSSVLLLTLGYAINRRQTGVLWALALATSSYSSLNNGLTVMEWPLVLLCWFLLHQVMLRARYAGTGSQTPLALAAFGVGFAGSFSRTDFGVVPAAYLIASLTQIFQHRTRASDGNPREPQHGWTFARLALLATAGASAALPLIFLYNHHMTGSWLQSSAQVKHLAASLSSPFNPVPSIWQFLRVLLYLPPLELTLAVRTSLIRHGWSALVVLAAATALVSAWARLRRQMPSAPGNSVRTAALPGSLPVTAAAIFGVAGYLLVYGFNTQATYGWYTAGVTGFILILTAHFFSRLRLLAAAAIVIPLMLANIATAEFCGGNARLQMPGVLAAKAMHLEHPGARMGGGDAGKPSFFNGGTMINLDGLMNNEALPYLASGTIHCYVLHRHIEYLVDIGTVTVPIVEAERATHHRPPIVWNLYFTPVTASSQPHTQAAARPIAYLKSDFAAIRASGECAAGD